MLAKWAALDKCDHLNSKAYPVLCCVALWTPTLVANISDAHYNIRIDSSTPMDTGAELPFASWT